MHKQTTILVNAVFFLAFNDFNTLLIYALLINTLIIYAYFGKYTDDNQ